jgi:hypothetical protein
LGLHLVSVKHTGTRYTRDHLTEWGFHVLQDHIDSPRAQQDTHLPAVVTIRDPFMCFLTWWKTNNDVIKENIAARGFFHQWALLDSWLDQRIVSPVIFHVDKQPIEWLAEQLEVEFKPVDCREQSRHYISDQYIQPRYEAFPQQLHDLAERWGYHHG